MPTWWTKKSSKHKDSPINSPKSPSTMTPNQIHNNNKPSKSFDELLFHKKSARNSKDYSSSGRGTSGFSGFDQLPIPSAIDPVGSLSGSSISSSGSSDDNNQLVTFRSAEFDLKTRLHGNGKLSPLPRSPRGGQRAGTTGSSPLHPRLSGVNIDLPTGRFEDGRSEGHRLPLPPGSPTSSSALPTPRTSGVTDTCHNLSKWKKGRLLGRGTFGHVYLGFNSDKGKMCAIKEVKLSDDQTSKECLKQLNQEINLLSQLCHPNIVQYYGSEMGEEALSVYLEYVSGGSIHKLLQEYGPFSEPVIQNYTRQILSGLAYLHGRNTVHRDIKGANILVDPNGEIKVADFGMAKHITACTSALSFKGSPYWMAPEVVMNTNGYNLQVDIWSLGCTVLEMATSKPPWSQFEGVAAIFKIGNSRELPDIPNHLSANAKSFIRLCLQREPVARPSASQLLEHPFVKDQSAGRSSNPNIIRKDYSHPSDGRHTPPALDTQSSRMQYGSSDGNVKVSRSSINPRGNARTIASLPVSPCSSPLRQHGSAQRNFLSPTHPSYAFMGQNAYKMNDQVLFPVTTNSRSTLDYWPEIPQLKAPALATTSQRGRLIL
ncbi:non-receptor serine/threonine protein kinase [Lithospermum erythrorhizon]|uniref:mitogen-activated protein kinase kinase kinase n=1 Tax=Lithospermum erythrorhizon TaxID=34254 RepID=A0AAV3NNV7_LITER